MRNEPPTLINNALAARRIGRRRIFVAMRLDSLVARPHLAVLAEVGANLALFLGHASVVGWVELRETHRADGGSRTT